MLHRRIDRSPPVDDKDLEGDCKVSQRSGGLDRDNTCGRDDKGAAAVEEEAEEDVDCYHGHQNTATKNKKCENKILQITSSTVVAGDAGDRVQEIFVRY